MTAAPQPPTPRPGATPGPRASQTDLAALADAVSAELPGIKVVKGHPDEAELAALVAGILSARAAAHAARDDGSGSTMWGNPGRRWGVPARPSRTAWRWSTHQVW